MALIDVVVNGDGGTDWVGFALIGVPLLAITVLSTILWRRARRGDACSDSATHHR